MNKILMISALSLSLLSLVACTETENVKGEKEPKQEQAKKEPNPIDVKKEISQITPAGGLGDALEVFNKNYGKNAGDKEMGSYKKDYILPMFIDGKAHNIMIQFEQTNKPRRTKEEAMEVAKTMIPKDANKVKEYVDTQDPNMEVIEYKSDTLKNVFEPSVFEPGEPGTFIVILNKDDNGYFGINLGTGNNP